MNWLNLLIITIILTGFFVVVMGLRLFLKNDSKIAGQSCHLDKTDEDDNSECDHCKVKEIVDCKERPLQKQ